MPCDSIVSVGLEMKNIQPDMLMAALKADGWSVSKAGNVVHFYKGGVSGDWEGGELTLTTQRGADTTEISNEIRRAYSAETVRVMAKKFGATVEVNPNDKNKLRLRLRSR